MFVHVRQVQVARAEMQNLVLGQLGGTAAPHRRLDQLLRVQRIGEVFAVPFDRPVALLHDVVQLVALERKQVEQFAADRIVNGGHTVYSTLNQREGWLRR